MPNCISRVISIAMILTGMIATVLATPNEWSKLYAHGEWKTLQHLYENGKLDGSWNTLWEALQAPDAEHAEPLYRRVMEMDNRGPAGKIAQQRLQQLAVFTPIEVPAELPPVANEEHQPVRETPINQLRSRELPVSYIDSESLVTVTTSLHPAPAPIAVLKQPAPTVTQTVPPVKPEPTSSNSSIGKYAAQFGVFSVKATADRIAQQIRDAGFTVDIVSLQKDGRTLYRIWCGRFPTQKEAAARVAAVKQKVPVEGITVRAE